MGSVQRLVLRLLAPWTRLNARHPWSHNDAYGWWIVRQARRLRTAPPRRALDVGCGTGNLLALLTGVVDHVTGLEPDADTAAIATARFAGDPGVSVSERTFTDRPDGRWDLVTMVAVLHHLPLEDTMTALSAMIKPGGSLVVVGLTRETSRDVPLSIVSVLLNPLVGMFRHPRPDGTPPVEMTAPTAEPVHTLEQIRSAADRLLPGARLRRRLFFRYTLTWTAPPSG